MAWNPLTDLPNLTGACLTFDGRRFWAGNADGSCHLDRNMPVYRVQSGVGGLDWVAGNTTTQRPYLRSDILQAATSPNWRRPYLQTYNEDGGGCYYELGSSTAQFNHLHRLGQGWISIMFRLSGPFAGTQRTIVDSRNGASTGGSLGFTIQQIVSTGAIACTISGVSNSAMITLTAGIVSDTAWHRAMFGFGGIGSNLCWAQLDNNARVYGSISSVAPSGNASGNLRIGARTSGLSTTGGFLDFKNLLITSQIPSDDDLVNVANFDPDYTSGWDTSLATPNGAVLMPAGTLYPASPLTDAGRGQAIRDAYAAFSAGSYVVLGQGRYFFNGSALAPPSGCALVGVGVSKTTLATDNTVGTDSSKACVQIPEGDGWAIADINISCEANPASYSFPIGRSNDTNVATTFGIIRCKATGYSDALYLDTVNLGHKGTVDSSELRSAYDTIALVRSTTGDEVRVYDSMCIVRGPFAGQDALGGPAPSGIANNVVSRAGTIILNRTLVDTDVTLPTAFVVTALRTLDGAGVIQANDCTLKVSAPASATGVVDADNDGSGSITINRGTGSGALGVPTTSGSGSAVVLNGPFTPPATDDTASQLIALQFAGMI